MINNVSNWTALLVLLAGGALAAEPMKPGPVPVRVIKTTEGYSLSRGGEPYVVKGAGIEFGDVEAFAAHGGNSFRTWRTDNGRMTGQEVLDQAASLGLTVVMCIEIGRERHGFDYDDEAAVTAQLEYARGEVLQYKDHPALLAWMIGNEPNLFFENPRVFNAINDISLMIHELDPHHPTTTALAGFGPELADHIATRSPDLDFVSIQMYGDIINLPRYLDEMDYEKPYFVTEWGAIGHWEVQKTAWDAPIEQNSSAKANNYLRSYRDAIAVNAGHVLGSFVFLWGQKQERTPTWYGMFLEDGTETETVDVMHYIWNGSWPDNRSPQVSDITLDGRMPGDNVTLQVGSTYRAQFEATDPDGDSLTYQWVVMDESAATQEGGDYEVTPQTYPELIANDNANTTLVKMPGKPGAYRLFAYVFDGHGHAGHANVPFLVED